MQDIYQSLVLKLNITICQSFLELFGKKQMTLFDMGKEDVESERDALEQVREMGYNMFGDIRTYDMATSCIDWLKMTPVGK